MSLKLGIALYDQRDHRDRVTTPHWALVAHATSYAASQVQVFQVRRTADPTKWALSHQTVPLLQNASSLLGVIHIADINMTPAQLDAFVAQFPATKNNDDPSGNIVWESSNWVIRILHYLDRQGVLTLACRTDEVYENVRARSYVLRNTARNPNAPVIVIPLAA